MSAPRSLQSIGISVFLSEYTFFANLPDTATAVRYLMQKNISNESGARIRISYARNVFENKKELVECLKYILTSKRTNSEQKNQASVFLGNIERVK